jgi:hypothetical protein
VPYAVLALSFFVALTVVMSRVVGRPEWLKFCAALGAMVAFVLWRLVPIQKWDRLF